MVRKSFMVQMEFSSFRMVIKLNFDGLARDENIMGGSVVRDAMGRFIVAYTIFFGEGTNNRAEFQALAEGLRVVHALSLDTILIKGDSSLVISAMKQQNTKHWALTYVLRQCLQQLDPGVQFQHVFCQNNQVADRLTDGLNNREVISRFSGIVIFRVLFESL